MNMKLLKSLLFVGVLVGIFVSVSAISIQKLTGMIVPLPIILALVGGTCGVFAANLQKKRKASI